MLEAVRVPQRPRPRKDRQRWLSLLRDVSHGISADPCYHSLHCFPPPTGLSGWIAVSDISSPNTRPSRVGRFIPEPSIRARPRRNPCRGRARHVAGNELRSRVGRPAARLSGGLSTGGEPEKCGCATSPRSGKLRLRRPERYDFARGPQGLPAEARTGRVPVVRADRSTPCGGAPDASARRTSPRGRSGSFPEPVATSGS